MKPTLTSHDDFTRREFITTSTVAGASLLLGGPAFGEFRKASPPGGIQSKKRYALVGTGDRSGMYREAVLKTYAPNCEMVGFCDLNFGRLKLAQTKAREMTGIEMPIYLAKDFDRMVREAKPDIVIVTSKDSTHDHYIIRAMELGCDVMSEKPMTTDEKKCRAILAAQRKTGRHCRVTFNCRYSPPRTQVKDLLMRGVIGDVLSVDFHWLLDTIHGADYFRRWHSNKVNSGGLMVHKATHHFDLVNWWLSAVPVTVQAAGKREFYTPQMARRLGLQSHHERCHTCPEQSQCAFALDLAGDRDLKELYFDNEHYDGYIRDRCVFRPDIDIEDTMNVMVRYNTGATLSYSCNAFNAWEGYLIAFNGTKGRLEHKMEDKVFVSRESSTAGLVKQEGTYIRVYPMRAPAYEVPVWVGEGGHGGGDPVMLDDLFLPEKPVDKYQRAADQRSGAYSILTGIAANHSFVSGRTVQIEDLVSRLAMPDYPVMPSHIEPVTMPPKV